MALGYAQVDEVAGKLKRLPSNTLFQETFATGNGSTTSFAIGVATATAASLVDVYMNGVLQEVTADYSKVFPAATINFGSAPPTNARIRIRTWS